MAMNDQTFAHQNSSCNSAYDTKRIGIGPGADSMHYALSKTKIGRSLKPFVTPENKLGRWPVNKFLKSYVSIQPTFLD
jgi:hypothetical protein